MKWPDPYKPISVVGKTFRNEKVLLDGYAYSSCEFYNVTFVYNGTTTLQFSNNKVFGGLILASDNPAVLGTLAMTLGFNVLKDNVEIFNLPPTIKRGKNVNVPQ
jgi:archaellum component FlaF (FlaF/FlaG flagellin family)